MVDFPTKVSDFGECIHARVVATTAQCAVECNSDISVNITDNYKR